jgi:salicylate hydroxylase
MTPFLGMGAAMAIEDAAVLARCLEASNTDWRDALRRYERARIDRANKIHIDSDRRGQEMFGSDPKGRAKPPGVGLDEVYMYDAMQVAI